VVHVDEQSKGSGKQKGVLEILDAENNASWLQLQQPAQKIHGQKFSDKTNATIIFANL